MKFFQNYDVLDQPYVGQFLFHPRPESGGRPSSDGRKDLMIPVADSVEVGGSFHVCSDQAPIILFFHGNGEIVQDYDDLGEWFTRRGLNFLVVDYRGYGRSSGTPSISAMMSDSHHVLDFLLKMKSDLQYTGRVCIMGRSLGSAPALELAGSRQADMDCLVIESGFARVAPLLSTLGLDPSGLGLKEEPGFENLDKMKNYTKPCLVIHAQNDFLIPFSQGSALFDACPAQDKTLLEINGAGHNDIFFKGAAPYLDSVSKICTGS